MISQDAAVGALTGVVAFLLGWGIHTHIVVSQLKKLPGQVDRLERRTLLILMQVAPDIAKEELMRDRPIGEILSEGVS